MVDTFISCLDFLRELKFIKPICITKVVFLRHY